MCLGIPAKILSREPGLLSMAEVDMAGQRREVNMSYLPEAEVGDYVLIQQGFAMTVVDAADAEASLRAIADLNLLRPERLPRGHRQGPSALGEPAQRE